MYALMQVQPCTCCCRRPIKNALSYNTMLYVLLWLQGMATLGQSTQKHSKPSIETTQSRPLNTYPSPTPTKKIEPVVPCIHATNFAMTNTLWQEKGFNIQKPP